ncbi:MAG: CvpA family protein [Desulfohalobiaceae bacterium]|nr:CvpA family protein [Desulfohalobiaceae bacterium]
MNSLDIIFCSITAFTLIRGLYRGLVKEFASIFGLIFGFLMANQYYEELSNVALRLISNPKYAAIISYILLFILALAAVIFLAHILRKFLEIVMLGWLDRLGGTLLGLGKGALLCCLILFVLTVFLPPTAQIFSQSMTTPYLSRFSQNLSALVPRTMQESFEQKSENLQQQWQKSLLYDLRNPE